MITRSVWPQARRVLRLLLLAVPVILSSCGGGGGLHPVHGRVLYEGQPAVGAVVFFHPQGEQAQPANDESQEDHSVMTAMPFGKVGPDGSFELTTFKQGRGAPAGRYAVTVSWTQRRPGASDSEDQQLLPLRYLHPATSGLSAEIKEGDNQLAPIQLTR